jgi:AcrR family transcriptional regulator
VQDPNRAERRVVSLLLAAAQEFSEKGYAETTLEDIARRCGVTKGLIYYYFRSKEDIYFELMATVIRRAIERVKAILVTDDSAAATLRKIVEDGASHVVDSLAHYSVVLRAQPAGLAAAHQRALRSLRREYEDLIQRVLERGIAEGEFADRDPAVMMRTAIYATSGLAHWFDPRGRLTKGEVVRQVSDQVMAGILRR